MAEPTFAARLAELHVAAIGNESRLARLEMLDLLEDHVEDILALEAAAAQVKHWHDQGRVQWTGYREGDARGISDCAVCDLATALETLNGKSRWLSTPKGED